MAKARGKKKYFQTRHRRRVKTKIPCAYGHVYSTKCGHCINMQADWDKLKEEIRKEYAIELVDISDNHQEKVDATNLMYKTDLKFSGFPTIFKIIKKHTPVQYYQGDRSKKDMKKWLFT